MSCQIRQSMNSLHFQRTNTQEPTFPQPIHFFWRWRENPTSQKIDSWSFYPEGLQKKTKRFSWTWPAQQVCGCGLRLYSWSTALLPQTCSKLEVRVKVLQERVWSVAGEASNLSLPQQTLSSSSRTYSIVSLTTKLCIVPTTVWSVFIQVLCVHFP